MINYYQFVPSSNNPQDIQKAIEHVRGHLSSVADADDDPETNADDVVIRTEPGTRESDGAFGTYIYGSLDAEPVADYLKDDFDPEDDIVRNPLTVESIVKDDA